MPTPSLEQRRRIVETLGRIQVIRLGVDFETMTPLDASAMIVDLDEQLRRERVAHVRPVAPGRARSTKRKHRNIVADLAANPDDPRHGTINGYTNGECRCDRCRDAGVRKRR